jgi:hypothetical protein
MEEKIESQENQIILSQWKLVRSAIEHENTLKSHRLTWLLATQLFLFGGFFTIFTECIKQDFLFRSSKIYGAFLVISSIGIFICALAWAHLRSAQKMISRLQNWWIRHYCKPEVENINMWIEHIQLCEKERRFPPINGIFPEELYVCFDERRLPVAIGICWFLLLSLATLVFCLARHEMQLKYTISGWVILAALIYMIVNGPIKTSLKRNSKKTLYELQKIFENSCTP